jgi:hypothetical protein
MLMMILASKGLIDGKHAISFCGSKSRMANTSIERWKTYWQGKHQAAKARVRQSTQNA